MNLRRATLLSSVALLASTAGAADLRVPQQFATIQAAVDAAQPLDRVVVDAGTYDENVVAVNKLALNIKGKKGAVLAPSTPGFGLHVQDSKLIEVRGLTVRGTTDTAIRVDDCQGVVIRKCVVRDSGFDAILVLGSTDVKVTKNDVADLVGSGIAVLSALGGGEIEGNEIARADRHGVFVSGPDYSVLDNEIEETGLPGIQSTGFGTPFEDLLIADNRLDATDGIVVGDSIGATILDNVVANAALDGITVASSAQVQVSGNVIQNAGRDGILLFAPASLVGNKVKGAGDDGVLVLTGGDGSLIKKNKIKGSDRFGLGLASSGHTVVKNTAKKSGQFDLVDEGDGNVFEANSFGTVAP